MSEWNMVRFEEISDFKYGKMPKKEMLNKGKYPVFTGYRIAGYYPEFMYEEPQLVIIARGVGGTGDVVISPACSYITNLSIVAILDKSKCDLEYLYYYFQNNSLRYLDSGSAQSQITIQDLKNLELPLPELSIQKKIAHLLESFDSKIKNNRQMNETLEGMSQAIFKSWFVDFDPVRAKVDALESGGSDNDARLAAMQAISGKSPEDLARLKTKNPESYAELAATADAFPSAFTTSPLGDIPEGWEVKRIEDSINRLSVGKKFSSKTASPKGKVPILDQGKSGLIGFHDEEPGVKASPEDPVIIFANHTCYMRLIMHDFSAIQNVLPFKPKDTHILWLYYATQGKQSFVEYKGHWPDFAIKEIIIPNNNLDEIYARYISSAVKKIFANELENQSLAETRDALLPKLLSGGIDVSGIPDTEAA